MNHRNIYWNLELSINEGSIDDFKALMEEMVASTKNEQGTLNYEWSVNADKTACHIYERYSDSGAVMHHLGNFQNLFGERFFSLVEATRFTVYGHPDDQVKEALSGIGAEFMEPFGGFVK